MKISINVIVNPNIQEQHDMENKALPDDIKSLKMWINPATAMMQFYLDDKWIFQVNCSTIDEAISAFNIRSC